MYKSPTGSLISENDYQFLSENEKAQCKVFVPTSVEDKAMVGGKTAEDVLREYVKFDDVNGNQLVSLLPITIVDAMEEYRPTGMQDAEESLNKIIELSQPGIPYYAYGDNEAACAMAYNLNEIGNIANSLLKEI